LSTIARNEVGALPQNVARYRPKVAGAEEEDSSFISSVAKDSKRKRFIDLIAGYTTQLTLVSEIKWLPTKIDSTTICDKLFFSFARPQKNSRSIASRKDGFFFSIFEGEDALTV